jgi:peroxiredoxin
LAFIRGENYVGVEPQEIDGKTFFDISLPSTNDKQIRLSEAGKDLVVLVDFTIYEMKESLPHNLQLSGIYNKYHAQGFQIYQVSLDRDVHFWKNAAANLPWICVIDKESVYSTIMKNYNVTQIPTAYIFNRKGDITKRIDNYDELEKEIAGLMKSK